MTRKSAPKVRLLFLAVFPIGAWMALIYFALVIVQSVGTVLEIVVRFMDRL